MLSLFLFLFFSIVALLSLWSLTGELEGTCCSGVVPLASGYGKCMRSVIAER